MAKKRSQKKSDDLLKFVRDVKYIVDWTEEELANEMGLPKPTVKSMCNPKAKLRASDEHLALIMLATGAEFSSKAASNLGFALHNQVYTGQEFGLWKKFHDMPKEEAGRRIRATQENVRTFLAAARGQKRLLVALYLLEMQLRKWTDLLKMRDLVKQMEALPEFPSTLSKPEAVTSKVDLHSTLRKCR